MKLNLQQRNEIILGYLKGDAQQQLSRTLGLKGSDVLGVLREARLRAPPKPQNLSQEVAAPELDLITPVKKRARCVFCKVHHTHG